MGDGRKGSAGGEGTKELLMDLVTSNGGHGPDNQPASWLLDVGREIRNKLSRTHNSQCFFSYREDASRCGEEQSR